MPARFPGGPAAAVVFFDVYQALDPGCGVVAVHAETGRLMGSCFYHPRPTHVSLGIMNAHPNYFRQGVARALLEHIVDYAEREQKPLRLVSSAMNLDSFSLYTRAGFVPRRAHQDMYVDVPREGLDYQLAGAEHVRPATVEDVPAIVELEMDLAGIRREVDFRYLIENRDGFWHLSVYEGQRGGLVGFMASSGHPGCNMIGPGLARTPDQAAALILSELNHHRGRRPVMLIPVDCAPLVHQMYQWGARNCELHFHQVRGAYQPLEGVSMPTFLPETG
jgi:GNAT superfamily N-acetyltransferase